MCLIGLALNRHPRWPLVLAANRDEFHARDAAALGPWPDVPGVVGGRDLVAGGSWLALRGNRLAAVTNVRRMATSPPDAPSRGWLVRDFVAGDTSIEAFLSELNDRAHAYAGFNLILVEGDTIRFASNRLNGLSTVLSNGIHVISNASLDTPWPKSERLRHAIDAWCSKGLNDTTPLLTALSDETPVPDAYLPDTSLPLERERLLATAFIRDAIYGTRASTIVLREAGGTWRAIERRFGPNGIDVGCSTYPPNG